MRSLSSFASDDTNISGEEDRMGGRTLESSVYDMEIEMAYMDKSKGGAHSINFVFKASDGSSLKNTTYFTNKQGKTYWEKNSERHFLPGYNIFNAICLLAVGKPFTSLATEEKMVNVYDFNQKKEVPVSKEVVLDLIGSKIKLGVLKIIENKSKINSVGKYVKINEKRTINDIDKVFRSKDDLTTIEVRAQKSVGEFMTKWMERWDGVDKDSYEEVKVDPEAEEAAPTPDDLFGKSA